MRVDRETFERWVNEAIEGLPPFFRERIDNVLFVVEDRPDPEIEAEHGGRLLGLYQGVPRPERSVWQAGVGTPDVITLYQRNIEAICPTAAEVKRQVYQTVLHELGHHFGLNEAELQAIEARWRGPG